MTPAAKAYYDYKESVDKGYAGGLIPEITDYVEELEKKDKIWNIAKFEAALHIIQISDELERFFKNLQLIEATLNSEATDSEKILALKNGVKCILEGKKYESKSKEEIL